MSECAAGGVEERSRLEEGLRSLGLGPDKRVVERLMSYVSIIRHWARGYNLVSRGDLVDLVGRHVLDSLAIHGFVRHTSLLDVGSGAGFPGLPLAIALPGLEVTLLDSSGKKVRFLKHVTRALDLVNAHPVRARIAEYESPAPDTVVSRAFASLSEFAASVRHLSSPATRVLAVKGRYPRDELQKLPGWVTVGTVSQYHVPHLQAERHVVIMKLSPEPAEIPD